MQFFVFPSFKVGVRGLILLLGKFIFKAGLVVVVVPLVLGCLIYEKWRNWRGKEWVRL